MLHVPCGNFLLKIKPIPDIENILNPEFTLEELEIWAVCIRLTLYHPRLEPVHLFSWKFIVLSFYSER